MNDGLFLYWFSFRNGERYGALEVTWAQSHEQAKRLIENDYLLYDLDTKALYERGQLELRTAKIQLDDTQCHLYQRG